MRANSARNAASVSTRRWYARYTRKYSRASRRAPGVMCGRHAAAARYAGCRWRGRGRSDRSGPRATGRCAGCRGAGSRAASSRRSGGRAQTQSTRRRRGPAASPEARQQHARVHPQPAVPAEQRQRTTSDCCAGVRAANAAGRRMPYRPIDRSSSSRTVQPRVPRPRLDAAPRDGVHRPAPERPDDAHGHGGVPQ